jgi:murein DD-endopeptidase MepM/ murein hydrolase activator NlpD
MRLAAGIAALVLVACAAAETPGATEATPVAEAPAPAAAPAAPAEPAARAALTCEGALTQGGVALCRTTPGAEIFIEGEAAGRADENGWAVIGFTRESPSSLRVEARHDERVEAITLAIGDREFDVQRVDGLPPQTVTPTEPEVLERIRRESALKNEAFASLAPLEGFLDRFILPVDGVVSGRWGNQRILNGVPSTPHFGYDIAAPEGTPIRAPASGVVVLAEPDMHYEGGLVFIDHGQGLISMYLHMSRLDVRVGDVLQQGQVIGAVGARGRATGPHLCWRMRWRGRQLDPSIAGGALAHAVNVLGSN